MERELVERARQGDASAFADIVDRRVGRLNAIARLVMREPASAEDAVQDALLDAWRDLPRLREVDRFDIWLHRILMRSCLDRVRRDHRAAVLELVPGATSAPADAGLAMRDEVGRALRTLTHEHRAVLALTYYLDLPLADSAAALGVPVGTMKSRLDRARAALRSALEAQERMASVPREQPV